MYSARTDNSIINSIGTFTTLTAKSSLLLLRELPAVHPVRQLLVVPPEDGQGVDHARQLPLALQLLLEPVAGKPFVVR